MSNCSAERACALRKRELTADRMVSRESNWKRCLAGYAKAKAQFWKSYLRLSKPRAGRLDQERLPCMKDLEGSKLQAPSTSYHLIFETCRGGGACLWILERQSIIFFGGCQRLWSGTAFQGLKHWPILLADEAFQFFNRPNIEPL